MPINKKIPRFTGLYLHSEFEKMINIDNRFSESFQIYRYTYYEKKGLLLTGEYVDDGIYRWEAEVDYNVLKIPHNQKENFNDSLVIYLPQNQELIQNNNYFSSKYSNYYEEGIPMAYSHNSNQVFSPDKYSNGDSFIFFFSSTIPLL